MRLSLGAVLAEARSVASTVRQATDPISVGPVIVSGMLAPQLARELSEGAEPGAVISTDTPRVEGAAVVVRVVAGEPSPVDDELVTKADQLGVPVVLVQLWPQAEWRQLFVLTPFVVECRAGEGFPIPEIAKRMVEAVEQPVALARRVPVLEDTVATAVVGTTAIRAAILGALGARSKGARPLIALEQVRMLTELRTLKEPPGKSEALPTLAGIAAAAIGLGYLFRETARKGQQVLPEPLVNAAVAAAGTWALGEGLRRLEDRIPAL